MSINPTMTMIAKEAKVSRTSVYAVLNSPANTNIGVSEEKRKRILEAAKTLGYVRNSAAQSLKTGKYFSIAILAQTISHAKFYRFFSTFDKLATDNGYFTFLVSSELDYERERQKLNAILEQGVDALVVGMLDDERNNDLFAQYIRRNIPVLVLADKNLAQGTFMAGFDEMGGACRLAEYLKTVGMTRLAYFRLDGLFVARLSKFKKACDLIIKDFSLDDFSCPGSKENSAGEQLTVELLKKYSRDNLPQAILCCNDQLASQTILALQDKGIRVPEDISVIGCDNQDEFNRQMLPLTTIDLPFEELAEVCWTIVEKALSKKISAVETAPVLISPKLIVRSSSPPLPDNNVTTNKFK